MRSQHDEHGHDKSEMGYIAAYPRQLESLIRLSEAFAKMRLSKEVTMDDVENAYEYVPVVYHVQSKYSSFV